MLLQFGKTTQVQSSTYHMQVFENDLQLWKQQTDGSDE